MALLEDELAKVKSEHEIAKTQISEKEKVEAEFANLQKCQKDTESKLEVVEKEKDDISKELEKEKSANEESVKQLKSIEESSKSSSEKYELEIKKLKDKLNKYVPKSDLDDLMLLMSDLDEKNKAYKKKLKTLGEDVSSDEESDEDDSDEDDEDEEDEE